MPKIVHVHKWERMSLFKSPLAYMCKCGAALTIGKELSHYSPSKPVKNAWTWKVVSVRA